MNVLLVNPPSSFLLRSFNEISLPDVPLNLAYLAAMLEADGHFVRIIDLNIVKTKIELDDQLAETNFELLGFTSTTPIITSCFHTIKILKKKFPKSKVVLGGWHGSAIPVQTLESCFNIDFVVKGEGEYTLQELVRVIENGGDYSSILGLVYRRPDGVIIENGERPLITNLDSLPYPAWHLLALDEYKKIGVYTVGGYFKKDLYLCSILTSRGCIGKCIFCADGVIHKGKCRFRSPENVVDEIQQMIKKHGIRFFFVIDSNFLNSPVHVQRICELIIKSQLKILWGCVGRVENVSEDLLRLMKAAGCIRISYGVESGSPKILKLMDKNISIPQIKNAVALTKKVGISVYIYFVYGMPGETLDDVQMSRQLLFELKPNFVTHSIATPYPGTKLFDFVTKTGMLKDLEWEHFNYPFKHVIDTPYIKQVFMLQRKIIRDFYISPFFIIDTLKNLKSIYHLGFYIKAFINLLKLSLII